MDGLVELQLMQGMNDSQRLLFQAQMAGIRKTPSTAVLLTLFTGGVGGQFFYLGKTLAGVLCVLFCWTFIPAIIGVINLFTISGTVRRMNEERARMIAAQIGLMSGTPSSAGSTMSLPPLSLPVASAKPGLPAWRIALIVAAPVAIIAWGMGHKSAPPAAPIAATAEIAPQPAAQSAHAKTKKSARAKSR